MADPQSDRCDVDEAEVAFGGLVIAGGNASGILELVEAPLDEIAQAVEGPVHDDAQPARLAHRDHRDDVTRLHRFANFVGVITSICEQHSRRGQVIVHYQVKAPIIRCLTRRDVRPHGQACAIDPEMDASVVKPPLERPKPCLGVPPFAPAA